MHRTRLSWVGVVSVFFLAIGWGTVGGAEADFPVNISGWETYGGSRTADGGRHEVTFEGWVGGTGPVPDTDDGGPIGWVASPGEGGSWRVVIDHCCASTRRKHHRVTILGGRWELQLPNGAHFTGSVESGTVRFPRSLAEDLGCGPGVTKVSAMLRFDADGYSSQTKACLDDLHDSPDPDPPIWGRIGTPQP
jgi:hypothetical protein